MRRLTCSPGIRSEKRDSSKHELITGMAGAVNRNTSFDYQDAEDVAKAYSLEETVSVVSWERVRKETKQYPQMSSLDKVISRGSQRTGNNYQRSLLTSGSTGIL